MSIQRYNQNECDLFNSSTLMIWSWMSFSCTLFNAVNVSDILSNQLSTNDTFYVSECLVLSCKDIVTKVLVVKNVKHTLVLYSQTCALASCFQQYIFSFSPVLSYCMWIDYAVLAFKSSRSDIWVNRAIAVTLSSSTACIIIVVYRNHVFLVFE